MHKSPVMGACLNGDHFIGVEDVVGVKRAFDGFHHVVCYCPAMVA